MWVMEAASGLLGGAEAAAGATAAGAGKKALGALSEAAPTSSALMDGASAANEGGIMSSIMGGMDATGDAINKVSDFNLQDVNPFANPQAGTKATGSEEPGVMSSIMDAGGSALDQLSSANQVMTDIGNWGVGDDNPFAAPTSKDPSKETPEELEERLRKEKQIREGTSYSAPY